VIFAEKRIERLWTHPNQSSLVVAAIYGNGEVSVWDLETANRHLAIWPSDMPVLAYKEVYCSVQCNMLHSYRVEQGRC